ncbi:TPA: 50S ribosomal protein L6 [Candidatus Saccharibacteria bacterium]|nr:50S ribosomal protein L6 [Candidatus Saccharibacteria bacterium]HIO87385.1 50S ribosomal protein L6 [Candidatus Saccharibacteria bacterium]
MSRIGRQPITIPSGVTVEIKDGLIVVRGSKGELSQDVLPGIDVVIEDQSITVARQNDEKKTRGYHGLMRTLIDNMIVGLSEGFSKELELHGVGYRVQMAGTNLKFAIGYSHDVEFKVPQGIQAEVNGNVIKVTGYDKQLVGQTAAQIREIRKPEPYKGKGIRYKDEYIVRKAGKTAA